MLSSLVQKYKRFKNRKIRKESYEYEQWREGRIPHFLHYHVPKGEFGLFCDKPFFDRTSLNDIKLTTYNDKKLNPVEVDKKSFLELTQTEHFNPWNEFIIYQHWGQDTESTDGIPCRLYKALDKYEADDIAKIIKGGPTRKIILVCTGFMRGSIRQFAETLSADSPHHLEMLGLFWYFSGDDITDEKEDPYDVAYAVNQLKVKRLSILTAEFNKEVEESLAEGISDNKDIKYVGIFQKEETFKWPKFETPNIDAIVQRNNGIQ